MIDRSAGSPHDPADSRAGIDEVLAEFDAKKEDLARLGQKTKSLLEDCLREASIRYQVLQVRVKSKDKLSEKYLDPTKTYRRLDDITDQVALRIITYYEDEVDKVAAIVKAEFQIDPENSVDKREAEPDKFGYYALNYVCKYTDSRAAHTEYRRFANMWFELQITSVLRHAWAEIEHPWYDLKDRYPESVKRKFYRLAALLELAESQFLEIKNSRVQYEKSVAVRVEASSPDVPVNVVTMKSFIEQEPLVAEIDAVVAVIRSRRLSPQISDKFAERRSSAAILAGMTKLQDVRDSLTKYKTEVVEYARRLEVGHKPRSERQLVIPGVSVQLLSNMLVNLRGPEETAKYFEALNVTVNQNIEQTVAIAKAIVRK